MRTSEIEAILTAHRDTEHSLAMATIANERFYFEGKLSGLRVALKTYRQAVKDAPVRTAGKRIRREVTP